MTDMLCADEALNELLTLAGADEDAALARIAALLGDFPGDPRLHFLKGSLLAAQARYDEGRAAMADAVRIAPGYAIARFQLGLLELSSGDAEAADSTLRPLADAAGEGALELFALGLRHLLRDEFAQAAALLQRGIEVNVEHPLVSRDMQLLLAGMADATAANAALAQSPEAAIAHEDEVSAAHLLLRRYADKGTRH